MKVDSLMFSGIENCWRIEASDSVVAEWVNCGSFSTSAIEPENPSLAQIIGDGAADDRAADDDDVVTCRIACPFPGESARKEPVSRRPRKGLRARNAAGHESAMPPASHRPRRSVLYVPASNERALAKIASLACDAVILDLEDAVAPAEKAAAREKLAAFMKHRAAGGPEIVIRINPLASEWGADDLQLAGSLEPDAILLPKVDTPRDITRSRRRARRDFVPDATALWAMIETPKAILNLGPIAELGRDPASRLACLVAGTNDLAKETGIRTSPDRRYLVPLLVQIVVAARAGGLVALDGVVNDFSDAERLARECEEAAAMGFDGKTLIHPRPDRAG